MSNDVVAGLQRAKLESDSKEIEKLEDAAAKIRQYLRLAIDLDSVLDSLFDFVRL